MSENSTEVSEVSEISQQSQQLALLVQLYEGAIDYLEKSAAACEGGHYEEFKEFMQKGRSIIEELQNTLNFELGGPLADQLNDLYVFMLDALTQAELTYDALYIGRVINLLTTLLGGWRGIHEQVG